MCVYNNDESEVRKKLRELDFSRMSFAHKNKLWKAVNAQCESRQLSENELDSISAAGMENLPEKLKKTNETERKYL